MDILNILNTWVNPTVVCFCLIVGYIVKHLLPKVSNRIIPTVVVVVGILISLWLNQWAVLTRRYPLRRPQRSGLHGTAPAVQAVD